ADSVGWSQLRVRPAIELWHDRGGVTGGQKHPLPLVGFESGQPFRERRHVGKRREPAAAGVGEAFDGARLDVADRSGGVGEKNFTCPPMRSLSAGPPPR